MPLQVTVTQECILWTTQYCGYILIRVIIPTKLSLQPHSKVPPPDMSMFAALQTELDSAVTSWETLTQFLDELDGRAALVSIQPWGVLGVEGQALRVGR